MTDYDQQARDFLDSTGTVMAVDYQALRPYFDGDDQPRDVYRITLTRGERSMSFDFGQSLQCSGTHWFYLDYRKGMWNSKHDAKWVADKFTRIVGNPWAANKHYEAPTAYDVLACLDGYAPESFEEFCSDYGYDTDSRSAERTYNAVRQQAEDLQRLYSDTELEALAEIA